MRFYFWGFHTGEIGKGATRLGKILLDSNVVIAFLETENENHEISTAVLLNSENDYFLASLSIAECLIIAFRQGYEFAIEALLKIKQLVVSVFSISEEIAFSAARIGAELNVALADSIIMATAESYGIVLWTFDKRLARKSSRIKYLLE